MFASRFCRKINLFIPVAAGIGICTAYNHNLRISKCNSDDSHLLEETTPASTLTKIRPDAAKYERIDHWMEHENYAHFVKDHAVHDTLDGSSKIEAYEIYRSREEDAKLYVVIKFGSSLNGHQETVHGGISALMLDNSYGWLYLARGFPPAFTANLVVNYRSPIKKESYSILKAKVDKFEGRKLYMSATIEDALTGKLQVESTTLFITMRK